MQVSQVNTSFSHSQLCKLALNWLKRPQSRGGHGCKVAIDECRTGWGGEIPDALGYRYDGSYLDGTVLVECKVSRADFLADKGKPHRQAGGVGNWRYFMAPEGIISVHELPDKWGLVEVNQRGHMKTAVGAFTVKSYTERRERLQSTWHQSDTTREFFLLVRMFDRISDPEKFVDLDKERNRLSYRINDLLNELREANKELEVLSWHTRSLNDELERYRSLHGDLPAVVALPRHT